MPYDFRAEERDAFRHAQRTRPTTRTEDRRAAAVGARTVDEVPSKKDAEVDRG